jgi:phage/plasmid primase-like uncharacterized protein
MISLHDAIFVLNPSVVTIRGDVAYDANEQEVTYDKSAAQAKLAELQAAEVAQEQTAAVAKQSAIAKLSALGLTADEIAHLIP